LPKTDAPGRITLPLADSSGGVDLGHVLS